MRTVCHVRLPPAGVLHVMSSRELATTSARVGAEAVGLWLGEGLSDMDEFSEEEIVSPDSMGGAAVLEGKTHTLCGSPTTWLRVRQRKVRPAVDVELGVVLFILLPGAGPGSGRRSSPAPDLDVGRDRTCLVGRRRSHTEDVGRFGGAAQEAFSIVVQARGAEPLSSPRYAPQLKLFQKRKRRRDSAALDAAR